MSTEVKYQLVVETNSYAGNFEREMTAFATGVLGECGVGEEMIESFSTAAVAYSGLKSPFENLMEGVYDDGGCSRPTTISQNHDGNYHNVTMFMHQRPSDNDLAFITQRIRSYPEYLGASQCEAEDLEILGIKLNRIEISTVTEVIVEL